MTVYVASAWFENSEPFVGIAGTNAEEVETALNASIEDTARNYESEEESFEDILDTVCWSGVHQEDTDTLDLSPAQLQELLGGWLVSFDAGDGSCVGHTDVLATEEEAQRIYEEWSKNYPNGTVTLQKVGPGVTYLDTN